jgi:hypothetical protein
MTGCCSEAAGTSAADGSEAAGTSAAEVVVRAACGSQ